MNDHLKKPSSSMSAAPQARLKVAMQGIDAPVAIYQLAVTRRDEGVDQISLYKAFSEALRSVDPDDLLYDALTETMDEIWGGGWAKRGGLYPFPRGLFRCTTS